MRARTAERNWNAIWIRDGFATWWVLRRFPDEVEGLDKNTVLARAVWAASSAHSEDPSLARRARAWLRTRERFGEPLSDALACAALFALAVASTLAHGGEPKRSVRYARNWKDALAEARERNVPIVIHDQGFG